MLGIVAIVELCYRRRIWRRFLCNLSKLFIFTLFLKRGLKFLKKWKLIVLPAIKRPDLQVRAVVLLMDLSRSMKTKQRRQRVNSEQIMPQKTSLQCKQLRSNYCRLLTFSHWHIGSGTSLCFSLFCKSINANSKIVSFAYIGILIEDLLQKLITYIMYHMYKMICRNIVRIYRLDREFVIQSWPEASGLSAQSSELSTTEIA